MNQSRESFEMGDDEKRQCHARESGHPDLAARAGALDSRFRGNDTTLKALILNDAHHYRSAKRSVFLFGFAKSARANIGVADLRDLADYGAILMRLDERDIIVLIVEKELEEVGL